jgi:hypothetical protein
MLENFTKRVSQSLGRITKRKPSITTDNQEQPSSSVTHISCPLIPESHTYEDQYLSLLEPYRLKDWETINVSCANAFCDRVVNQIQCGVCTKHFCNRCIYEWKMGSVKYAVYEKVLIGWDFPFCCIFCYINNRYE